LAVAIAIFGYSLIQLTSVKVIENSYEDFLITKASSNLEISDSIVVIEVREGTLSNFPYRSPLDRGFLAKLLGKLVDADAKAIGLDIIFDQPSEVDKDNALKSVFKKSGSRIFAPELNTSESSSKDHHLFQNSLLQHVQSTSIAFAKDPFDGMVRHYFDDVLINQTRKQPLTRAMVGATLETNANAIRRIFYQSDSAGNPAKFKTYPAEAAMLLPSEWFKNKYVLIGKNISNIDQFRTSYSSTSVGESGTFPGVQIHAHILNQLVLAREITELGWFYKLGAMLLVSAAGAFLLMLRTDIWVRAVTLIFVGVVLLGVGYFVFIKTFVLLPMSAATFSLLISSALLSAVLWQSDRTQKQFIRQAWSQYVSKNVVDSLIADPKMLKLGGDRIEASYIFTDIEGFTSLSETLTPEKLSDVINEYLDLMTEEFRRADATIDKIMGDAVVGFIGAPLQNHLHAEKAVTLALALDSKSREFREEMLANNIKLGKTRIGINSGEAIVGNFGGDQFFDYTAIGDAVNIAARLEGANKATGGTICVSRETMVRAKEHTFRPIGQLQLYGKDTFVETWEPMTKNHSHLADFEEYEIAFGKMQTGMKIAASEFEVLRKKYPDDHLVDFHFRRLKQGKTGIEIEVGK
jgi:adenylate cyclase